MRNIYVFIVYLRTTHHVTSSNGSLFVPTTPVAKGNTRTATMLLFYSHILPRSIAVHYFHTVN
jgi:hypothetical protein